MFIIHYFLIKSAQNSNTIPYLLLNIKLLNKHKVFSFYILKTLHCNKNTSQSFNSDLKSYYIFD